MKKTTVTVLSAAAVCLLLPAQAADAAADSGTTAWMLTSTALVLLMVPGLAPGPVDISAGLCRSRAVIVTVTVKNARCAP